MDDYILTGSVLFLIGLAIGSFLANKRWTDNAKHIQRIEHAGKLYKVFYAERVNYVRLTQDGVSGEAHSAGD